MGLLLCRWLVVTSDTTAAESVKWYTHVRRVPTLLGAFSDGSRLWGGPYTILQLVAGAGFLVVAQKSHGILWSGTGTPVVDLVFAALLAWGVALAVGKLDLKGRNPIRVAYGLGRVVSRPGAGSLGGARLRLRSPHRFGGRDAVIGGQLAAGQIEREPTPPGAAVVAAPLPAEDASRMSSVQLLLAGAGKERGNV